MLIEEKLSSFCNNREYKKMVSREDRRGGLRGEGSANHYYCSEPVIAGSVLHFMEYINASGGWLIIGPAVCCLFEGGLSYHSLVVKALGKELLKWDLGCFCQRFQDKCKQSCWSICPADRRGKMSQPLLRYCTSDSGSIP